MTVPHRYAPSASSATRTLRAIDNVHNIRRPFKTFSPRLPPPTRTQDAHDHPLANFGFTRLGRLAPGACTPPPPTTRSQQKCGDARALISCTNGEGRVGIHVHVPTVVHSLPAPPIPLSSLSTDESERGYLPYFSPHSHFMSLLESPPPYDSAPASPTNDDSSVFLHSSPLVKVLARRGTSQGMPASLDFAEPPDLPALSEGATSADMNMLRSDTRNALRLQAETRLQDAVLDCPTMDDIRTIPSTPSSLSERLRRLAPPPLRIPEPISFVSDSGVALDHATQSATRQPVTALYFPIGAQGLTPLEEYDLLRAPARGSAAGAAASSSRQVHLPLSPASSLSHALSDVTIRSPTLPPLLRRTRVVELPPVTPQSGWRRPSMHQVFSPLRAEVDSGLIPQSWVEGDDDTREHVSPSVEIQEPEVLSPLGLQFGYSERMNDLEGRCARCAEAVDWIKYSLGSCTFISANELEMLCTSLKAAFALIAVLIHDAPDAIHLLGEEHGPEWQDKYEALLHSLDKNINYYYLQADQLGRRPPRIHHVASIWQKLWSFLSKFENIAHNLEAFYEHIRILQVRERLKAMKEAALQELETERSRRKTFKATAAEARARRKETRAVIRRAEELARVGHMRRRSTTVLRLPS